MFILGKLGSLEVLLRLLVVFSPDRRGDFVSLVPLLMEKSMAMTPVEIDRTWNPGKNAFLMEALEQHPWTVFLMTPADLSTAFFSFSAAYSLARHRRTYYWDSEGSPCPDFWRGRFSTFHSFEEFVGDLWAEAQAYSQELEKAQARQELERRGRDVSVLSLVETVEDGDVTSLELYLKAGFSPDTTNRKGVPLLNLAVRKNHEGAVKSLLAAGAGLNILSKDRQHTPLMDAAVEGHLAIVKILLSLGADLDVTSQDGQTALTMAVGKNSPEVALALLDHGARWDIPDKLGMSAQGYASLFQRQGILDRINQLSEGKS